MIYSGRIEKSFLLLKEQVDSLKVFSILQRNIDDIKQEAERFKQFDDIIIIGTGGSSLGGKALLHFGMQFLKQSKNIVFLENIDSMSFLMSIKNFNQKHTGVIVISKSGRTTEPLMLFTTLLEMWQEFDCKTNCLIITEDSGDNDLLCIAKEKDIRVFYHEKDVGGRFSVFSVVGLLPALITGIDVSKFLSGAKKVLSALRLEKDYKHSIIFNNALSQYKWIKKGINQHVIFSYSNFLEDFGKWCSQLIAESLGKREHFGVTPISVKGTVDQHSMLQLFLDGPKDKYFTVITQQHNSGTIRVNPSVKSRILNSISGHNIDDLMISHQRAIIEVLRKRANVRLFHFDEFDLEALGFLMMTFMVETIAIADIARINPFNQPAVEESKKLAMLYLSEMKQK